MHKRFLAIAIEILHATGGKLYYSEIARIKKIERFLERLAYGSVALDFIVALATLMVIKGLKFSKFILLVSGYMVFVEIIIASVIFLLLVALKHYRRVIEGFMSINFGLGLNIKTKSQRHKNKDLGKRINRNGHPKIIPSA